jgi:hypothetical protein
MYKPIFPYIKLMVRGYVVRAWVPTAVNGPAARVNNFVFQTVIVSSQNFVY